MSIIDTENSERIEIIARVIIEHVEKDSKIAIYGDYDTDGTMSAKILYELLEYLEHSNSVVYNYQCRTHSIDHRLYNLVLVEKPDLVIIADTGSSDIALLKKIKKYVKDVIIIDHHETIYLYSEFDEIGVYIFNNYLDKLNELSDITGCGGSLCYLVAKKILDHYGKNHGYIVNNLALLATIALYADVIDMSVPINRNIYHLARGARIPDYLDVFRNKYQNDFRRNFIEYTVAPCINGTFRWEYFMPINKLFFEKEIRKDDMHKCISSMEAIRNKSRAIVSSSLDLLEVQEIGDCVLVNLTPLLTYYTNIPERFIINNKGRFAGAISDKYNKPCVAICDSGRNIEGSFRDTLGRDLLSIVRFHINAQGHGAAFGFKINYSDYPEFLSLLESLEVPNKQKIYKTIDMLSELNMSYVREIAFENEFTNTTTNPILCINYNLSYISRREFPGGKQSYRLESDSSKVYYAYSNRIIEHPQIITLKPYYTDTLRFVEV